jgi:hypothetical protein
MSTMRLSRYDERFVFDATVQSEERSALMFSTSSINVNPKAEPESLHWLCGPTICVEHWFMKVDSALLT